MTIDVERYVDARESAPSNEAHLVTELTRSFNLAKDRQRSVPAEYQPDSGWAGFLGEQWPRYYQAATRQDIESMSHLLRNFFRNEGIAGLWGNEDMFGHFVSMNDREAAARKKMVVQQLEAWREALPHASVKELAAPGIGNPWGYSLGGTVVYEPAFEYHYQACYCARLLRDIANPVIAEIGGGFGGLAYQLHKQIPGLTYLGFDLPELLLIQSYYLKCAFPSARIMVFNGTPELIDRAVIDGFDFVLMPNYCLPQVGESLAHMVLNFRSLSEMSQLTIAEYLLQIQRICSFLFYHENIYKQRSDGILSVPASEFPAVEEMIPLFEAESRWPIYGKNSAYPCREYLFLQRRIIRRAFGLAVPV
jgi:putative sugar O-methyltransferase